MKISIITVCLNNPDLEKTIRSVLAQGYKDYDYWIIDGGSDNPTTLSVLDTYKDQLGINIISEKDTGPYDAMNKGIKSSTGEYLIFLNSGDCFYSGKSLEFFASNHDNYDIIYGDLEVVEPNKRWIKQYPDKLSFKYFLTDTLPHPSSFIKRSVFEKVGLYQADIKISADWAFFVTAICLHQITYKHLPQVISSFNYEGMSSLPGNRDLILAEKKQYLETNFPLFIGDYLEIREAGNKYNNLKNSRLRKYLSLIFKQLEI